LGVVFKSVQNGAHEVSIQGVAELLSRSADSNQTLVLQYSKVLADIGLTELKLFLEILDATPFLPEKAEDAKPGRVGQSPKLLTGSFNVHGHS
jgi:hypothetical protein